MDVAGCRKLRDQREDRHAALLQILDRLVDERVHRRDDADGFALAAELPELGGDVLRRKILRELDADMDRRDP